MAPSGVTSGTSPFSLNLALLLACSPQASACGGETTGNTAGAETTGTRTDLREAALARAARFVDDYQVTCRESSISFDAVAPAAYEIRVLQVRGRPGPYHLCAEMTDSDAKFACWERLSCDSEWWNELDWSQWSEGATVIEIVGLRPEQINVAPTSLRPLPDPADPNAPVPVLMSFYEHAFDEPVPPGSHDCGYYWYLDPTPEGVALVLSAPLAGDLEGDLEFYELNLCLTE